MNKRIIKQLLKDYGLRQILEDNNISIVEVLQVLDELGYLDLEQYNADDEYP